MRNNCIIDSTPAYKIKMCFLHLIRQTLCLIIWIRPRHSTYTTTNWKIIHSEMMYTYNIHYQANTHLSYDLNHFKLIKWTASVFKSSWELQLATFLLVLQSRDSGINFFSKNVFRNIGIFVFYVIIAKKASYNLY